MSSIEETLISKAKLFITLVTSGTTEDKTANLIKLLNEGANVNECFENYCNYTPLHIAVMKEDFDIVKLLLDKGADITLKSNEGKTALDAAKELNTETGLTIIEMLEMFNKNLQTPYEKVNLLKNVSIENVGTDNLSLYQKRTGTTGIKGELYETKLLSLILLRTLLNQNIDQFYLGTSVQGIGALDDICLRFKENDKESVVFLQAKHITKGKITVKDLWKDTGNYSLSKYFDSYLKIKQKFESTNKDNLVQGKYEDTSCHFVIYTTAEEEMLGSKLLIAHSVDKTVEEILSTGENKKIFQYKYDQGDIRLLTKIIMLDRMKQMGKKLYQFTQGNKFRNMLCDKDISGYHVALANKVIDVSPTVDDYARNGTFREEFLSSNNELLIVLKETIFKEAVSKTKVSSKQLIKIVEITIMQPSVRNISTLLQTVPTSYDLKTNKLDILNNHIKELPLLFEPVISYTTYNEIFQKAIREKLDSLNLRLPMTFGNVDFNLNKLNVKNTLSKVMSKIENVISQSGDKRIIINTKDIIDPSLIGNVIIFDDDSRMFKFNTSVESVGQNANSVLNKLNTEIKDLDTYRFQFNIDNIPKIAFEADEYDNRLAKDFLNHLWFYTGQAKEHEIEEYARDVLEEYYHTIKQKPYNTFSNIQSDAIFLKIHNEVQKWWLLETTQAYYITRNMQIYDKILKDLPSNNLLSILNYIYVNDIQRYGIDFNEEAVQSLGLDTLTALTVIETGNKTLTAIKLFQFFGQKNNHTFIDLNYVSRLSVQDNEMLLRELVDNDKEIIIIIHEHISNDVINLNKFLNSSVTKKIILVINENCLEKLINRTKIKEHVIVRDEKNRLQDLTLSSQRDILKRKLMFQGIEVSFEMLIDAESQRIIGANILNAVISNETIEIGKVLTTSNYEQIKNYYVQRSLCRSINIKAHDDNMYSESSSSDDEYSALSEVKKNENKIKTLQDIKNTVLLMAAPGMGKSTLLTHLSIETKKINPRLWIERINLLDHVTDFYKWQEDNVKIDHLEALRFLCKTVISRHFSGQDVKFKNNKRTFDIGIVNGVLSLENCNELDSLIILELETFMSCYNKGNTILIFDGFDEICPHYKNNVLDLLKCLTFKTFSKFDTDILIGNSEAKQQMWITSRPYNDIKETLETEFGPSFTLNPFTNIEQHFYVEKYLSINLNLKDLNYQQFQRIDSLFEYMVQFSDRRIYTNEIILIKSTSAPLHTLYCAGIAYFQGAIRNTPISVDKVMFKEKWNSNIRWLEAAKLLAPWNHVSEEAMNLARTPLHMYLAMEYFENQIKDPLNITSPDQWDLDTKTFAFYKTFLEIKLKKIRFEGKNRMDLQNPDLRITYERERAEFVTKHKQLAFYSIFRNEANKILDDRVIDEIQETIRRIENGEEKTGLIEFIMDGVPKFVHLTFAEYLAVEYVTDLLQSGSYGRQIKTWDYIFDVVLATCSTGVLEIFDRKVNCDPKSIGIVSNIGLKEFIVDKLLYQFPYLQVSEDSVDYTDKTGFRTSGIDTDKSILDNAVHYGMKNLAVILLTALTDKVTEHNLDQFIAFIEKQYFFKLSIKYHNCEILELILNCVRRVDNNKLYKIYMITNQSGTKLPAIDSSNREIIDYLKVTLRNRMIYPRRNSPPSPSSPILRETNPSSVLANIFRNCVINSH